MRVRRDRNTVAPREQAVAASPLGRGSQGRPVARYVGRMFWFIRKRFVGSYLAVGELGRASSPMMSYGDR
jgi:hypothetical protein